MGSFKTQRAALEYFCPTERSDAASATTLNQGWLSSRDMKR
jgi:hypothetical protein